MGPASAPLQAEIMKPPPSRNAMMMMKTNRPRSTRLDLGPGPKEGPSMPRFAAVFLLLGLAGCGGDEVAQTPPTLLSLSREQVEAIKTQDEAIEEEEGGAFKRRVESLARGKKTRLAARPRR